MRRCKKHPGAKLRYFAVWYGAGGHVLDVYPDEIARHRYELSRRRENFAGPFDTKREAVAEIVRHLVGEVRPQ